MMNADIWGPGLTLYQTFLDCRLSILSAHAVMWMLDCLQHHLKLWEFYQSASNMHSGLQQDLESCAVQAP